MTCKEIIVAHLKATGADGLCSPLDGECGCGLDNLFWCCECFDDCVPAREVDGPDGWFVPLDEMKDTQKDGE